MNANSIKYLLLTTFVLLVSCQKGKDPISDLIVGKWEWVRTENSWTGIVSNPHTAGYSLSIEFTDHSILKEYKNDTLIISTNYSIETSSTDPNSNILIYNPGASANIYINNDTLILNNAYIEGPVSFFNRLK